MTEIPEPPALAARGGCWFEAGTAQLHLGADPGHRAARKAHPALTVADIDTLADRLAAADLPVIRDRDLPGRRRFHSTIRRETGWSSWRTPKTASGPEAACRALVREITKG